MADGVRLDGKVPAWFWAVAVLAVLWEGFGCWQYVQTAGSGGAPGGLVALFAVAVWSGLAGAVALLLRSRWALWLLLLSLIAALIQYTYVFTMAPAELLAGPVYAIGAMVILAGALLVWFARVGVRRGWLR